MHSYKKLTEIHDLLKQAETEVARHSVSDTFPTDEEADVVIDTVLCRVRVSISDLERLLDISK